MRLKGACWTIWVLHQVVFEESFFISIAHIVLIFCSHFKGPTDEELSAHQSLNQTRSVEMPTLGLWFRIPTI